MFSKYMDDDTYDQLLLFINLTMYEIPEENDTMFHCPVCCIDYHLWGDVLKGGCCGHVKEWYAATRSTFMN